MTWRQLRLENSFLPVNLSRHSQRWSHVTGPGSLLNLQRGWHLKMGNSGCRFQQGNKERGPLLRPDWWPPAQQGSWKDFKGKWIEAPLVSCSPIGLCECSDHACCWDPSGRTGAASLNCRFMWFVLSLLHSVSWEAMCTSNQTHFLYLMVWKRESGMFYIDEFTGFLCLETYTHVYFLLIFLPYSSKKALAQTAILTIAFYNAGDCV